MTTQTANAFSVSIVAPSGSIPAYITSATAGAWTAISLNTCRSVRWTTGFTPAGGFQGIMDDWGSGCYDENVHKLYIAGGGHGGNEDSGIYGFDMTTRLWSNTIQPSPYSNPGGNQPNGLFPDGSPQAIHTYGSLVVNPNTGKIYILNGGGSPLNVIMEATPGAAFPGCWMPKASNQAGWSSGGYSGSHSWDSVTQKFWGGHAASDWFIPTVYDPINNTHVGFGDPSMATGDYASTAIHQPTRQLFVVGGQGNYASRGCWSYNLNIAPAGNTGTTGWTNRTSSTTGNKFPETDNNGAMVYDSKRGYLWYFPRNAASLFQLNVTTLNWSAVSPTSGSMPPAPPANETFGRFRYCPEYDVFVYAYSVDGSVYIYKPVGWTGP